MFHEQGAVEALLEMLGMFKLDEAFLRQAVKTLVPLCGQDGERNTQKRGDQQIGAGTRGDICSLLRGENFVQGYVWYDEATTLVCFVPLL